MRGLLVCIAFVAMSAFLAHSSAAQDGSPADGNPGGTTAVQSTLPKDNSIAGMKFGVGLSFTWDKGTTRERVDDAFIDANGIVRVSRKNNALARIMLESHYFFKIRNRKNAGWGPFVAVQPGSNEIISALGLGIMVGWKRSEESNESFNIGFGYSVDPSTQILGAEFVENQPAPIQTSEGPTKGQPLPIRFQTRDQGGFLILSSFTWH